MPSALSYFCGLAAMVYITTCLVVAAVRWFHMCRPYDRRPDYYYPSRNHLVGIFLNSLVLLPCVAQPESGDAWYLARVYFLPVTIHHFSILLFSYFGSLMNWQKWRRPMLLVSWPLVIYLGAAFVLAVWPGEQIGSVIRPGVAEFFLLSAGMLNTGICATAIMLVFRWARGIDLDDFSNPVDFPAVAARSWLWMILGNVSMCWVGSLAGSHALMAVVQIVMAAGIVAFILTALHPQRTECVENTPAPQEAPQDGQMYQRAMPAKKRHEILAAVKTVVEDGEAFLDPHLTLQDVSDRSGYSRTYISGLLKAEHGGFFSYINQLRLQHVDAWLAEHPGATVTEAAEESGFTSRQAYYKVRAHFPKE